IGRHYNEFLPPSGVALLDRCRAEASATGETQTHRYPLTIGGELRWFEASTALLHANNPDGGHIVVSRDVTEDQARREQVNRLSEVARHMTNFAVVTDKQMRILWV